MEYYVIAIYVDIYLSSSIQIVAAAPAPTPAPALIGL